MRVGQLRRRITLLFTEPSEIKSIKAAYRRTSRELERLQQELEYKLDRRILITQAEYLPLQRHIDMAQFLQMEAECRLEMASILYILKGTIDTAELEASVMAALRRKTQKTSR